jgi:hypothetical protein
MKSLNVLLDAHLRIRICDFGFSRHATEDSLMTQNIGTPHWMAPELLSKGTNYTSKIDVYAYGIVLWELATGQTPYVGLEAPQIVQQVLGIDLRPTLPMEVNPGMRDLITQCWDRNPDVRPTFDEIVHRIQSTTAMFNGTNRDELLQYIHESATTGEQLTRNVECTMKGVAAGEIGLREATRLLQRSGVPPGLLELCWTTGTGGDSHFGDADLAQFLGLFAKSSKMGEAAALLRRFAPGSVAPEVMNLFVAELPTGSDETDSDIVVAACKNGCAGLCSVYVTNPVSLALSLNVVAHTGVELELKAAVADRCVQSLRMAEGEVAVAAMRCLLSMREFKRIHPTAINSFLSSTDERLSACAYVSITAAALEGFFPPMEVFLRAAREMATDRRAGLPVAAACRDEGLAVAMLDLWEAEPPVIGERVLKVALVMARHKALRKRLGEFVARTLGEGELPDLREYVVALQEIVGTG